MGDRFAHAKLITKECVGHCHDLPREAAGHISSTRPTLTLLDALHTCTQAPTEEENGSRHWAGAERTKPGCQGHRRADSQEPIVRR